MRKLSQERRKVLAGFLSNSGVAWFSIGVVGPLLTINKPFSEVVGTLVIGLVMAVMFVIVSMLLTGK